jgi:hypothetical protein
MEAAEIAEFPAQGCCRLRLLLQHGFGFQKPRLKLRVAADEVAHRLAQEGEILLEAADLLQAVDHVGEADADQLVLLAHGIEGAVRADHDGFALLGQSRGCGRIFRGLAALEQRARDGVVLLLAETVSERRPTRRHGAAPCAPGNSHFPYLLAQSRRGWKQNFVA